MAKARKTLEQELARLRALRAEPERAETREALAQALASPRAALLTLAGNVIGEAELSGFAPALRAAFERCLEDAVKRDPGCAAKTSLARALYRLGERAHDVYLRGVRHVQREPVWGGSVDTAVELRGVCALALVRTDYPDALIELADLLADPEPTARVGAAQAIAYSERDDVGLPLLRVKARLGDVEPRVTAACFSALLALAPERSLSFVTGFLRDSAESVREAALLALGESRLAAALAPLCTAAESAATAAEREVALTAIALLRSDEAWSYLLALVRDGSSGQARGALDALATYRADGKLRERVLAAVGERGDAGLGEHAERVLRER
jgi:HEAT repeat protein